MSGHASGSVRRQSPDLRAKVAFLSDPASYPAKPAAVEVVQTHMSCVFLTDRHAYKLKKPVRFDFLDFSSLEARRVNCEEELRLNRRLARDVYIEVIPLMSAPDDRLVLGGGGGGEVVDWLVKMRRLPARLMLDHAMREGGVTRDDVRRFTRVLAGFYRHAPRVVVDPGEYRERFRAGIRDSRHALAVPEFGLPPARLEAVTAGLLEVVEREAPRFDRRVLERRIVEGHGDLRPEHVCLEPEPLFIDCLEFSAAWRRLDPADELSYLAMECEYAGAPWIGEVVLDTYRNACGDDPPATLLDFYAGFRAVVRAKLAAWHLRDHLGPAEEGQWIARARRYLELAERHARAAIDEVG
jgi:aminoglycoside phosphotransferase family enzyme